MSSVTNGSSSTGFVSHGSSLSSGSGNMQAMMKRPPSLIMTNFQRSFSKQLKMEDKSQSLKIIAAKFNEMTLDWFSCASPTSEQARAKPFNRNSDQQRCPFSETEIEDGGIEIDEGSSLRTAYQLERV